MPAPLRCLPKGLQLVHITARTLQGRHLLKPSPEVNRIIAGVLARGQKRYEVIIHDLAFLSNHYHLILRVRDAEQQARFMNFIQSNLARKLGAHHGWEGRFWSGRYKHVPITWEEAAQLERLEYIFAQGCKEGLVADPRQWPGLHSAKIRDEMGNREGQHRVEGVWLDETAWRRALRRGEKVDRRDYEHQEILELTPLPLWAELTPEQQHCEATLRVQAVIARADAERAATGRQVLGARKILRGSPLAKSPPPKKRRLPRVHAASREVREEFLAAYRLFVEAFREAAEALRKGNRMVEFPPGSFPPGRPFVPHAA